MTTASTIHPIPFDLDPPAVGLDDVFAARARLAGVAIRTPAMTSRALDERTGAQVFLEVRELPADRGLHVSRGLQRRQHDVP